MTRFVKLANLLIASALFAGCASRGAELRLTPESGGREAYVQRFGKAYASQKADGELHVVLAGAPGKEVDQVMHLRVLWKPMRGTKADQPSTTNATIDWYVFGPPTGTSAPPAMLRYTGAGFVVADASGTGYWVRVKNASLKLAARRGDLNDPVSPATLHGAFRAETDPARVEEALALIKEDTRAALAEPLHAR